MADDEVRLTVRIPRDLHARIRVLAAEDHRSLNGELLWLLEIGTQVEARGR